MTTNKLTVKTDDCSDRGRPGALLVTQRLGKGITMEAAVLLAVVGLWGAVSSASHKGKPQITIMSALYFFN